MNYLYQYLITFASFLLIDAIWLTTMAPRFYRKYIGHLMADKPDLVSAGIFYAIYVFGILYLVIQPALKGDWSMGKVLLTGAIFGFVAYATFDLTNQAVLKDWSKLVTVVDLIWGTVLTGSVSIVAFTVLKECFNMQGSLLLIIFSCWFSYMGVVTLGFLYSLIIHRNDIADIMWGLSFLIATGVAFMLNELNLRSVIVMVLVALWSTRLALHIHRRNKNKKEEDYRYAKWRKEWGKWFIARSYAQVYLLQGFLAILVVSPALFIITLGADTAFTMIDVLGILIWLIGFFFESIGDHQLAIFMKEKKPKGMIMQRGLWKYTRHPNYFGEVTQWWGIWLMTLAIPNAWISLFGPLTITYLIVFVSGIPMLEDKLAQNPDYKRYMKRTSKFFPLPPKPF